MKLVLLSCFFLIGCASSSAMGSLFTMHSDPPISESIIYFYISQVKSGLNACLIVTVDGEEKGCIGNPGYVRVTLDPGEHFFSFRPDAIVDLGLEMKKFKMNVAGGRVYYIESKSFDKKDDARGALQVNYVNAFDGFWDAWVLSREDDALEKLKILRSWR